MAARKKAKRMTKKEFLKKLAHGTLSANDVTAQIVEAAPV